jgi:hypothetical protein
MVVLQCGVSDGDHRWHMGPNSQPAAYSVTLASGDQVCLMCVEAIKPTAMDPQLIPVGILHKYLAIVR